MNWFVFIAGVLYLAGALKDALAGNYALAGIFVCYALANFMLSRLG